MDNYRLISQGEIASLKEQRCHSEDWTKVWVAPGFRPERVWDTAFSGDIRLGVFETKKELPAGIPVSYTHLRAHETVLDIVCRLLLEKKNYSLSITIYADSPTNIP